MAGDSSMFAATSRSVWLTVASAGATDATVPELVAGAVEDADGVPAQAANARVTTETTTWSVLCSFMDDSRTLRLDPQAGSACEFSIIWGRRLQLRGAANRENLYRR